MPWFDVYDTATDSWSELPDMPRARDHFQAQVVGTRFFAIGGRDSTIDSNLAENDAFDFSSNRWIPFLAPMPTPRGGYASAVIGHEIVILGGEAPDRTFAEVEAYDTRTNSWRVLDPMPEPRHGIQAVGCSGNVYVAAGGLQPYGESPSNIHSVYEAPFGRLSSCPAPRRGRYDTPTSGPLSELGATPGAQEPDVAPVWYRRTTLRRGTVRQDQVVPDPQGCQWQVRGARPTDDRRDPEDTEP